MPSNMLRDGPVAVLTGLTWDDGVAPRVLYRLTVGGKPRPGLFVESTKPDPTRNRHDGSSLARLGDRVVDLERSPDAESAVSLAFAACV